MFGIYGELAVAAAAVACAPTQVFNLAKYGQAKWPNGQETELLAGFLIRPEVRGAVCGRKWCRCCYLSGEMYTVVVVVVVSAVVVVVSVVIAFEYESWEENMFGAVLIAKNY